MFASSLTLVTLTLVGLLLFSAAPEAGEPLTLEVFTAADFPVSGQDDRHLQGATVTIYAIDGLEQFESTLSQNLPADTDAAKVEALRRIGELDDARMALAKDAAIGLAKAAQYGVARYPAIVVNGTSVLYGAIDLVDAVARYEGWREGQAQ